MSRNSVRHLDKVSEGKNFDCSIEGIKSLLNPHGSYSEEWNRIFLLSTVIAVSLDPIFFYIIVVNEDNKCLLLDTNLGIAAICLRSVIDCFYVICIVCRLHTDLFAPLLYPRDNLVNRNGWKIVRRYLLSWLFPVDMLAILPLPQVVILLIIPAMKGTRFVDAMDVLKFVIVFQYMPRILRIYPLFKRDKRTSGILSEAAWAKAAFNLFLYLLAGHVLGALCSFGQNLQTSSYIWENCFALFITISGLVLFLFLIGNVQIYLQTKTMKLEEMRLATREIKEWKPFKKLSNALQGEVNEYQRYIWQQTKGVDVEKLLQNLPKELTTKIKRELCFDMLNNVEPFRSKGEKWLDSLCYCVKPVLFIERNHLIKEGDIINEMVFIVQGELQVYSKNSNDIGPLQGNFCGEELVEWVQDSHSAHLPVSTKTIQALTKVEAFTLQADDLKRHWAAAFLQSVWRRRSRQDSRTVQRSSHGESKWRHTV
ncbi:hypothetical protein SLEP1_g40017 [Rubroshorea leprosula]|uniref:Cyclic nucleotide-binding domain-containing protein n=1 Tax=Rubroshorea leprosula TaxID=152421 RepID=A0AAV5L3F5_9ROSI|nr:hypothetical protein SLEP1_g40017 [Rubroshorea leprosula]